MITKLEYIEEIENEFKLIRMHRKDEAYAIYYFITNLIYFGNVTFLDNEYTENDEYYNFVDDYIKKYHSNLTADDQSLIKDIEENSIKRYIVRQFIERLQKLRLELYEDFLKHLDNIKYFNTDSIDEMVKRVERIKLIEERLKNGKKLVDFDARRLLSDYADNLLCDYKSVENDSDADE